MAISPGLERSGNPIDIKLRACSRRSGSARPSLWDCSHIFGVGDALVGQSPTCETEPSFLNLMRMGLERSGNPGPNVGYYLQPRRGWPSMASGRTCPCRAMDCNDPIPRVSASLQPWADGHVPSGQNPNLMPMVYAETATIGLNSAFCLSLPDLCGKIFFIDTESGQSHLLRRSLSSVAGMRRSSHTLCPRNLDRNNSSSVHDRGPGARLRG